MFDGSDGYETGFEQPENDDQNKCPDCSYCLSESEWMSSETCPHCGGDLSPF